MTYSPYTWGNTPRGLKINEMKFKICFLKFYNTVYYIIKYKRN